MRARSGSATTTSPTGRTRRRREHGLGYVPEDRQRDGLLLGAPCWENGVLGHQTEPTFSRGPWIDRAAPARHAREIVTDFDVRTPEHRRHRLRAVGRQPAEADRGPRDDGRAAAADRRPPHPGRRRGRAGRDLGPPPRRARRRARGAAGVGRPRGADRSVRLAVRHVPRAASWRTLDPATVTPESSART